MKKFSGWFYTIPDNWRPLDLFCGSYLVILSILIILFPERIPYRPVLVIGNALSIVTLDMARRLRLRSRNRVWQFVLCAYPLLVFLWIYKEIGMLVNIFHADWFDAVIIDAEYRLFGVHLSLWSQRFISTGVTEWMMFAYFFYVPLLPIVSAVIFFRAGERPTDRLISALTMAYGLCFMVILLIPMEGPRFTFSDFYTRDLGGSFFRQLTIFMEQCCQNRDGCFPSPHCAAGTVMLIYLWKYHKAAFYFILPVIISFYISTVYGRYHYISDMVAGIFIGVVTALIEPKIEKLPDRLFGGKKHRGARL